MEPILSNMRNTTPLMSYYYAKKDLNIFAKYNKKIYLDSGVFTARKKGEEINIKELISYTRKNEEYILYVFNIDSGPAEKQLQNYLTMKSAGCNVLPIWHNTMKLDMLLPFTDNNDYIAISESFMEKGWKSFDILDSFFEFLYKHNLKYVKVHALGLERADILTRYPFYSSDSSTFQKNYIFGQICNFNGLSMRPFNPKDDLPKALKINSRAFEMIGRTYEARDLRIANAVLQRERLQIYLTDLWTKRGVIWQD